MKTTKRSLIAVTAITILALFTAGAAAADTCISADYVLSEAAAVVEVNELDASGAPLGDGSASLTTQEGRPVALGAQLYGAVLTNTGSNALDISFSTGHKALLEKGEAVAIGISNQRICVCRCTCGGFDSVDIQCDSSAMNCASLNGSACEDDDGDERELEGCTKIYVKPAALAVAN